MRNFLQTTYQKIYEAFNGVRTKDTEFDVKVEELKGCEKSFIGIKQIFSNFFVNTRGLKIMCRDVFNGLVAAYNDQCPYWNQILEISRAYKDVEALYDSMADTIGILANKTTEWDKIFEDSKINVALREQNRRIYDHYDEKLEKLVRIKNDKINRNIPETAIEIEMFNRVNYINKFK
jgi:hypothetical protein